MTFCDNKCLLMLDDPCRPHEELRKSILEHNFRLDWTDSPDEALKSVREGPVDLGLVSLGKDVRGGLASIRRLKSVRPNLAIIAISPFFITGLIMRLIELDTYSFLIEPVNFIDLERLIFRAFEMVNEEGAF